MGTIKTRASLGANLAKTVPATWLTGGWNAYQGPGLLRALVLDYASDSSGCVLTAYDTASTATNISIFTTGSNDTDAGTTVPIQCFTNGDLVNGTSTDNVKAGIPFARGLYIAKTVDSTHDVAVTAFITPLIRKSVNVRWQAGSAGSGAGAVNVTAGPGLLHGYRVKSDTLNPTTVDFLLKDSPLVTLATGAGLGNQLMVKTDYGYATEAVRPVATTTGIDETGAAVTTSAGAYCSPGIFFTTGLNVSVQQANVQDASLQFDFLIEQ